MIRFGIGRRISTRREFTCDRKWVMLDSRATLKSALLRTEYNCMLMLMYANGQYPRPQTRLRIVIVTCY